LLITLTALNAPAAEVVTGLASPIAECIATNAAKVEQAVASLPEATQFLVDSVCAAPISAEREAEFRARSQMNAEKYKQLCEIQKQNRQPSQNSDEEDSDPCRLAAYESTDFPWTIFDSVTKAPADATSYAAKLLLELRLSHIKRTDQH